MEGLVCMVWGQLESRRVRRTLEDESSIDVKAELDAQCRACGDPVMEPLLNASCISEEAAGRGCR